MVTQVRVVCVAVFVLVAFCLAEPAFADKASRIELADGTAYENVTFTVDKLYQVVTIEVGDWKQKVDFADVARIVDEGGEDITARVLGDQYKPVEKKREGEWLSKEDPRYKAGQKRPFDFAIRGGGHYSFPMGDYYEGFKSGIGYGFDAVVTVTKNVAIRGSISRAGLKDDLKEMLPGIIILEDDLNLSVWRYAICGQYYQWPDWKTGGKFLYYGFAGLGAVTHKMSGNASVQEPPSGEIWEVRGTGDTESKFMLTYGGGLITMISDRVGVEFGLTLDVVFVGDSDDLDVVYYGKADYADIFDLKVGVIGLF
jgi:opacity protein-like surface antigen